jgi:Domain of unknown function (DUF4249)
MGKYIHQISIFLLISLVCCVEPYNIQSVSYDNLMVIDGFISADVKQHKVAISRTSKINEKKFIAETGAQVSIKDGSGAIILLKEESPGIYLTAPLAGIIGNTYKLQVTTQNGKQYASEKVQLKNAPEIKNIYATYSSDLAIGEGTGGIQIFLDSEDPTNQTNYYRWEFKETYEIKTPYPSSYIWPGGNELIFRDVPVDRCWSNDSSKSILIKSTKGLAASKVTAQLIQTIPGYSPNMRIRYSILVKQFALSQNAYLYWKALKDVNESQGTLYDRQPGTVRGNVTSLSDKEVVVGYFDAGAVTEKRVFFTPDDFTDSGYKAPKFLTSCYFFTPIDVLLSELGAYLTEHSRENLIVSEVQGLGDVTVHLRPKYCCDCTNLGSNKKPSYWP